jgi:hypothetical protein
LQEEKERQLAKVKERVTQVRYERTLTMAPDASTSQGGKSFSKLLTEEEKRLNLDEQMTTAAQRMQDTFIRKAEEEVLYKRPTETELQQHQIDKTTKWTVSVRTTYIHIVFTFNRQHLPPLRKQLYKWIL